MNSTSSRGVQILETLICYWVIALHTKKQNSISNIDSFTRHIVVDDDVRAILSTNDDKKYMLPNETRSNPTKDFKKVLRLHPDFGKQQRFTVRLIEEIR